MVNKPSNISGCLIDPVYIKETLIEEFFTHATVQNIQLSDHDTLRIANAKNAVSFHTVL